MRTLRRYKRAALLPALLWLAAQVVMAGGYVVAAPATAGGADRVDGAIWICTPAGPRLLTPEAGDAPAPPAAFAGGCYWCHGFGVVLAPDAPGPAADPSPWPRSTPAVARRSPDRVLSLRPAAFRSRAPPFAFPS